jgi:DNA-binding NarL/FixJ family response regulator
MDIQMPVMDGLEATRRILEPRSSRGHTPRIIILTTFELDEYVFEALRAGASGFLIKNTPPEALSRRSAAWSRVAASCHQA